MSKSCNITSLLDERRRGKINGIHPQLKKQLHFHPSMISKMSKIGTLDAHDGCVNCLSWSSNGQYLISGSDDTTLCIWDYNTHVLRHQFDSGHSRNIFGVKFLPETNNEVVVSGAMDFEVRIHEAPFRQDSDTMVLDCHAGRVKEIAVEPGNPNLFWSAGEDGTVRQWDRRLPFCGGTALGGGQSSPESAGSMGAGIPGYNSSNCLVNLGRGGTLKGGKGDSFPPRNALFRSRVVRAMSVSINPVATHQIAVAAGDQFTRLYDRRMLSLEPPSFTPTPFTMAFQPPHATDHRNSAPMHATSVRFSPDGTQLLTNCHNSHVYLYHASSGRAMSVFGIPPVSKLVEPKHLTSNPSNGDMDLEHIQEVETGSMEYWALQGHALMGTGRYQTEAIDHFSNALLAAHKQDGRKLRRDRMCQILCWRAEVLLQRRWRGDCWLALRDAGHARKLHAQSHLPHLRYLQALYYLRRKRQCHEEARKFKQRFPYNAQLVDPYTTDSAVLSSSPSRIRRRRPSPRRPNGTSLEQPRVAEANEAVARTLPCLVQRYVDRVDQGSQETNGRGSIQDFSSGEDPPNNIGHSCSSSEDISEQGRSRSMSSERRIMEEEQALVRSENIMDDEPRHSNISIGPTSNSGPEEEGPRNARPRRDRWVRGREVSSTSSSSHSNESDDADVSGTSESDLGFDQPPRHTRTSVDEGSNEEDEESDIELDLDIELIESTNEILESVLDIDLRYQNGKSPNDYGQNGPVCSRILQRYVGACNIHTDIKEADFLGSNGQYIVAGSDDGRAFIWEKKTGRLVNSFEAEEDILNCVQTHPCDPVLATSGIESVVKLWPPMSSDDELPEEMYFHDVVQQNQRNMNAGPWTLINQPLMRQILIQMRQGNDDDDDDDSSSNPAERCIQS